METQLTIVITIIGVGVALGVCAAEKFSGTVFHNKVKTLLRIG